MLYCLQPFVPYQSGGDARHNPLINRVERKAVACGRCEACVKNRKQDWAGKLCAEYLGSATAAFVTLTYAKEQRAFDYGHVQEMMHRLRKWCLRRRAGAKVRFFCVGERGDKFGRRHWHMLLFFDKPVILEKAKINTKWEFWPHGWSDIQMLTEREQALYKMRYCVKYAVKDVGGAGERPRCSLKPSLGAAWFAEQARDMAKAGLAPDGKYRLPGVYYKKGPRKGHSETFTLRGASRRVFIKAWRAEWSRLRGDTHPTTDWLQSFDEEAIDRLFDMPRKSAFLIRSQEPGRLTLRRQAVISSATSHLIICAPDWSVELHVQKSGPTEGQAWIEHGADRYLVRDSISDALDLRPEEVVRIDKWLALQRGKDYGPVKTAALAALAQEAEQKRRLQKAERSAALREHCERTRAQYRVGSVFGKVAASAADRGPKVLHFNPDRAGDKAGSACHPVRSRRQAAAGISGAGSA